jgi:hypothetical protein
MPRVFNIVGTKRYSYVHRRHWQLLSHRRAQQRTAQAELGGSGRQVPVGAVDSTDESNLVCVSGSYGCGLWASS